jgi:polysaccharide export outer membrane protein
MPVFGLAAQEPSSPPAAVAPPAAAPTVPPAGATDPSKLAQPKPSPDAKVGGAVPVDEKTYVIGPEDNVLVSVWEQPQLSCNCVVRSDGMITVQLIGEIKAAGLTPLELKQRITDELSAKALNDPQVSVSLVGAHSKKYYLYGQVKSGGMKELIMPTTVLEAIVAAGGFQDFAKQTNITIARGDKRLKFNFKEVMAGKNLKQNIYLESGDIIYVK